MKPRGNAGGLRRAARVLTALAFFCFSGLNNGWTAVVVSQGKAERLDFAPVAIRELARAANPLVWKKAAMQILIPSRFFPKSAKVIECASQNALRQMLFESSLLQIRLKEFRRKVLNHSKGLRAPDEPSLESSSAGKAAVSGLQSFRDDRRCEESPRESCLMERFGGKSAGRVRPAPGAKDIFKQGLAQGLPKKPIKFTAKKLARLYHFRKSDGEDAAASCAQALKSRIPAGQKRPEFFCADKAAS